MEHGQHMNSWAMGGMWTWTVIGVAIVVLLGVLLWKQTRK